MTMTIRQLHLAETTSTNSYLLHHLDAFDEDIVVVSADHQTAGRGQGSNQWESEPGKNLLFSILIHPSMIAARQQFVISMMVALAMKQVLSLYINNVYLKWPNDMYWQDSKIGGILIETTLQGSTIRNCVIGVGLNVNQTVFRSHAPNPISLSMVTGRDIDRQALFNQLIDSFKHHYEMMIQGGKNLIMNQYHAALYRRRGSHLFRDRIGLFRATIDHVDPDGQLSLRLDDGTIRQYAFKEVEFIINQSLTI